MTARTTANVDQVRFLAALVPYRAGEAVPEITAMGATEGAGFRIGDTRIASAWGAVESGRINAGDLKGSGRLMVRVVDKGQPRTIVVP